MLLDIHSTVLVFKNPNFLTNMRRSNSQLKVHTNGGTHISSLVGDIKNFGTVWYNPNSLANIFSLAAVRKLCRITMDTSAEAAAAVTLLQASHAEAIVAYDDNTNHEFRILPSPSCPRVTSSSHRPGCFLTAS